MRFTIHRDASIIRASTRSIWTFPNDFYPHLLSELAKIPLLKHVTCNKQFGEGYFQYESEQGSDEESEDEDECGFAYVDVMKSIATLQTLPFELDRMQHSPWDPDLVAHAGLLVRLNRCGRSYIANDPGNKHKALHVFERVQDDLGCVWTHLKEFSCL